jgi:co-chaperonin GroES (HSP10)
MKSQIASASWVPVPGFPANPSGFKPTEYKVLVEPLEVSDKIGSFFIPPTTKDREQFAQTQGTVIAVSPLAFSYASKDEWAAVGAAPPKPGDVVVFAKFAGMEWNGKDGKKYKVINDKDITGCVE